LKRILKEIRGIMEILTNFLSIITDKSQGLLRRFKYAIIIIFIVFCANDYSNFLFNYKINQKIDQLKSIYEIYPDSLKVQSEIIIECKKLEKLIINKKSILARSKLFTIAQYNKLSSSSFTINWGKIFFYILKYHLLYALIAFLIPFVIEKNQRNLKGFIFNYFVLFIISMLSYILILAIVPQFNNEITNVVLNFITQIKY
jgi:hypothetical protein